MALVTVCGVMLLAPVLYRQELTRLLRRWHERRFPPEAPRGRPFELVVRDLVRVRRDVYAMSPAPRWRAARGSPRPTTSC